MTKLSPEEYASLCWDKVHDYIQDVKSEKAIVGKYIKLIIAKYEALLNDERYVYRKDRVDKVFKFFSLVNVEHKNSHVQFPILPFQAFMIAYAFGFYYKDNQEKRVVREVFLFVARKNGKTAFAAALQLYGMLADGVVNPQSLLLANTAQQATVSLNFAKSVVYRSEVFKKRLVPQRSRIIYRDPEKQGFIQIFSSFDSQRLEAYSPSMAILDEVHGYPDNTVYAAIKTGTGARLNPMIFLITTAGKKENFFLNDYLKMQKQKLEGIIDDDTTLPMIYQPDETDDIADTTNWKKANPALGHIITEEDLIKDFKLAAYSYADKYIFLTKHLNVFYDNVDVWIPEEFISPLFNYDKERFIERLIERDCYVGMDLSKTGDLSSIVLYFPATKEDPNDYVLPYFWMADVPGNEIRKSGRNISDWIYEGWITKNSKRKIDLDDIYDKIVELNQFYNIISIQYDPYNAPDLVARLKERGFVCESYRQNATSFNAPLKMLEAKIYDKSIKFTNPMLLLNFSSVVLYTDSNANIKIVKNKRSDSVDGVVALGMAIGGYIKNTFSDEAVGINNYLQFLRQQ